MVIKSKVCYIHIFETYIYIYKCSMIWLDILGFPSVQIAWYSSLYFTPITYWCHWTYSESEPHSQTYESNWHPLISASISFCILSGWENGEIGEKIAISYLSKSHLLLVLCFIICHRDGGWPSVEELGWWCFVAFSNSVVCNCSKLWRNSNWKLKLCQFDIFKKKQKNKSGDYD